MVVILRSGIRGGNNQQHQGSLRLPASSLHRPHWQDLKKKVSEREKAFIRSEPGKGAGLNYNLL